MPLPQSPLPLPLLSVLLQVWLPDGWASAGEWDGALYNANRVRLLRVAKHPTYAAWLTDHDWVSFQCCQAA